MGDGGTFLTPGRPGGPAVRTGGLAVGVWVGGFASGAGAGADCNGVVSRCSIVFRCSLIKLLTFSVDCF